MRALHRPNWYPLPLLAAGLVVAGALAVSAARQAPRGQDERPLTAAPSRWTLLATDAVGECAPEDAGRDGSSSYWAVENGFLHLRLCTAGAPGWQPTPTGWTDARYKWFIDTPAGQYLLLLEDAAAGSNDQGAAVVSDGRGDITLLDDPNRNGRFEDDWASTWPPAYLTNAVGSRVWRRAWSLTTGPVQSSAAGSTGDIGFALGAAACGPTVDMYVRLALLGSPPDACVAWATDPEGRALDSRPACDNGGRPQCLPLAAVSPSPIAPPTATSGAIAPPTHTPAPIVPSATPLATDTARPLPPTDTPSPTEPAPTEPAPTDTPVPEPPPSETPKLPTFTAVPPTATEAAATATAPAATATEAAATVTQPPPSATPDMTATGAVQTATASGPIAGTATGTAHAPPTATDTATPPGHAPTATASATAAAAEPTATPPPGTPDAVVCVHALLGGLVLPFPEPATVHVVLLTPWGWPAKPVESQAIGADSCSRFYRLEPGQYRVWVSVPAGWEPVPGTPPSQTLWIVAGQPAPSQCVFRYQPCASCPPGAMPSPPGPPPIGPLPGTPGPFLPTVTPTSAFPAPPGPPTPYPYSPDRPAVGSAVQLPVLGYLGNDAVCQAWVEAQNIGDRPAKALLLLWGEPGFCPPQCAGPLKVECSGLLAPGSAWNFLGNQMPRAAKSGLVISANADPWRNDIFADALCEALFRQVVGDCAEYRRFRMAYDERRTWNGFDFGYAPGQPLAVEALRNCPGDVRPNLRVTSSYAGVAGEFLGRWDPVYGGYAFFTPSLLAGFGGYTSILYIQNAGLECTSVELWFKSFEDCLRPRICDVLTLAPGESHQFDTSSCMPSGWAGSAWVRSSEPLALAVDHVGNDVLMTYTGVPGELNYVHNGQALFTTGSTVAFGPLVYSEYQGWDTTVVVQNLSRVTAAKVKVYFLDRSGGIITTVIDWVCPGGAQPFFLPVLATLPGNWVGSVRVESQDWFSPGGPAVRGPNVAAVAHLVQYGDIARSEPQEAIAYNLFPESLAYEWSLGSGPGGLSSGVGRIGIPSFLKDRRGTGVTTEISVANVVAKPGITNYALFIYDQNGLIDYVCQTLSAQQVEYIDLENWGFIHPGFKGSAVISATFWEHEVFDSRGGFVRNVVGLAAVKVERSGTTLGSPIPGDESAGNEGFPIPGPFRFAGPSAPRCPGAPGGGNPPPPPGAPTATVAPPPGGVPTPPGPPPLP